MADAPSMDFLHKQIGPLPVGGWVLVVGAGVGFAYWRNKRTPTTTQAPDTQGFTDPSAGNPLQMLGLLEALNRGGTGQPTAGATDNNSWYQNATRNLLAKGYVPSLIDTALRKYMQGMSLSTSENAIVELALQFAGPLPYPPPPPTTTPGGNDPQHIKHLTDYVPVDFGSIGSQLQHLSNADLIKAANLTYADVTGIDNTGWGQVVGMQYGTDQPLPYLNEIARRYTSGSLSDAELGSGPTGSWTSGQPSWRMNEADIVNRINYLNSQGITGSAP